MGLHFINPINLQKYFFSSRNTKKNYKKTINFTYTHFNAQRDKKRGHK